MDLNKETIEKIESMTKATTYRIGNNEYADKELKLIHEYPNRPKGITFSSLDGIVKAIKTEIDRVTVPLFVSVTSPVSVSVFTTYREDMDRDVLYNASPDLPSRQIGTWLESEDAIISLRSQFVQNGDSAYVLDILSSISDEKSVASNDNGMTQTVNVKQGIALQSKKTVKPRVRLAPYRTFLEVEQPESDFLLRMRPGDREKKIPVSICIFEADGGAWKLRAKHNIAEYFNEHLKELIEVGKVVVTE